jgi:hypothetical protein
MKKLLAVAVIGLAGYKLVKKLRNKNEEVNEVEEMGNEEVVENVEEEIVIDNDEEAIEVEDVEIVNEEKEEMKIIDKIKRIGKKLAGRLFGFLGQMLIKINRKLEKDVRDGKYDYEDGDGFLYELKYHLVNIRLYIGGKIVVMNRKLILWLLYLCRKIHGLE